MSLASAEGVNVEYLQRLKTLADEIDPFIVSDHLCWTGLGNKNIHDLLPFPHTTESKSVVLNNIDKAQTVLKRPIAIENVSTYLTFSESEETEWDFLVDISRKSGAKILFDLNNVYVSSQNHGFDPQEYIDAIPTELIAQIHLAGFTDMGDFLFDTHSKPVYEPVWKLFSSVIKRAPSVPFMMEWDGDIPEFPILEEEVQKALNLWQKYHRNNHETL